MRVAWLLATAACAAAYRAPFPRPSAPRASSGAPRASRVRLCEEPAEPPLPAGWKQAKAPDGRTYYYLPGGKGTQWVRPTEPADAAAAAPAAAPAAATAAAPAAAGEGEDAAAAGEAAAAAQAEAETKPTTDDEGAKPDESAATKRKLDEAAADATVDAAANGEAKEEAKAEPAEEEETEEAKEEEKEDDAPPAKRARPTRGKK